MYEISINLPNEFVNAPLYLMRHESKPRVLAQRIAGVTRPGVQMHAPRLANISLTPAAAAAVNPAAAARAAAVGPGAAVRAAGVAAGRPMVRIQPAGTVWPVARVAPRSVRLPAPVARMVPQRMRLQAPAVQRMPVAAGVRAVIRAPAASVVRRAPALKTIRRPGQGLF